jgi:hypothetical protein
MCSVAGHARLFGRSERTLGARINDAFVEAMHVAVEAITSAHTTAWFAHAGSTLPAHGNQ